MLLLITGASGVGKTMLRRLVQADFADVLDAAELVEIAGPPEWSLRWRHRAVEQVVQHALRAQHVGRHVLLCGDPVPPGEVYAAPSADALGGVAVCLLDATEDAQRHRLAGRGDDPTLIPPHVAFATWMRAHVADPTHHPEVIAHGGCERMQWDRWLQRDAHSCPRSHDVITRRTAPRSRWPHPPPPGSGAFSIRQRRHGGGM